MTLMKLEEMEGGAHEFLPEGAGRKYSIAELLSGVLQESPESIVKEVLVSYTWRNKASVEIVDQLQDEIENLDIKFIRDKSEMNYKDSIRDFMRRIGRGKCIIVVVSKDYLESNQLVKLVVLN